MGGGERGWVFVRKKWAGGCEKKRGKLEEGEKVGRKMCVGDRKRQRKS